MGLLDFVGNPAQVPIPAQLRSEAGVTEVILSPNETGYYEIEDVPPGTYDISFKPSHWLRRHRAGGAGTGRLARRGQRGTAERRHRLR